MTSSIHLDPVTWTLLCDGACTLQADGHVEIHMGAVLPVGDAPSFDLYSTTAPIDYTGADNVYGRARQPGAKVNVSGAGEQPSIPAPAAVAPVVTAAASLTPSSLTEGEQVVIDLGSATGTPAPVASAVLRIGPDRLPVDQGETVTVPRDGTLELIVTWRNGVAPNAISTASAAVAAAEGGGPPPPPPGNSRVAVIAEFSAPYLDFDSGHSQGGDAATIPFAGSTDAPDGLAIMGDLVLSGSETVVAGPVQIGTASGGTFSGSITCPATNGALQRRVWVEASDAGKSTSIGECGAGHVVVMLGQSEVQIVATTGAAQAVSGLATGRFRFARQTITSAPGVPVTGHAVEYDLVENMSGGFATHIFDMFEQSGVVGPVTVISMSLSGTGRWYLGDDTEALPTNRRRWAEELALLNAAGYADGVRPGVVVDM
jgi:hypothetical protein